MDIQSKLDALPERPAAEPLQMLNRRFREIRVLIRRLRRAAARGAAPTSEQQTRAFEQVRVLLAESFAAEERLMTTLTYWGYRTHRADHEQLHALLAEFAAAGPRPGGGWDGGIGALLEAFIVHHYSYDAVFLPERAPLAGSRRAARAGAPGPAPH